MRVAVAGATGVVGRHVVDAVRSRGHEAVPLARALGVDVCTGRGVDEALDGAEAVIDVINVTTTRRDRAVDFFTSTSRNLLAAGERRGVRHHVVLSIVGVERVPFGYYGGKRRQEDLLLQGPVPGSVLRATQFHEFAEQVLSRTRGPVALVPVQRIRPVAAAEVADALVALAEGTPQGLGPEIGGPDEHQLVDMARAVLRARSSRRKVWGVRVPGEAGRAMAGGALLPGPAALRGRRTFQEWLDGR